MRLLDRYLLRELLTPLTFCLGGFLVFWLAFDLFTRLNELQASRLSAGEIVWYYFLRLPDLLVVVMPVGLLLAMLYALTTHARHHELTAIRAAGVSLWRLALPYIGVGLTFSLVFFAVNEWWGPRGGGAADRLLKRNRHVARNAEPAPAFEKLQFKSGRDNRIWALSYNWQTHEMRDVHVDWQQPNGALRVFAADRGIRTNRMWKFFNVRMHTEVTGTIFPTDRVITNELTMPQFTETPDDIKNEIEISDRLDRWQKDNAELPLDKLIPYLRRHPNLAGRDRARFYTKLHERLAAPWKCLVVVLIAIPFGAASGRRNVFVGVAGGIFICFAYFILLQVGLVLGAGEYLPPWLAAWLPNLLFGVTALFFTFRVR